MNKERLEEIKELVRHAVGDWPVWVDNSTLIATELIAEVERLTKQECVVCGLPYGNEFPKEPTVIPRSEFNFDYYCADCIRSAKQALKEIEGGV